MHAKRGVRACALWLVAHTACADLPLSHPLQTGATPNYAFLLSKLLYHTTSWFWMTDCSLVLSSDDLSGEFFLFLWVKILWWQSSLATLLHWCSVMSVIICADALMTNRLGERGATAWHRSKSAACTWTGWFTPRQKPDRRVASRAKADRRLDRIHNTPPRFHMSSQARAGMQVTACS